MLGIYADIPVDTYVSSILYIPISSKCTIRLAKHELRKVTGIIFQHRIRNNDNQTSVIVLASLIPKKDF
jgi:hypothetical protein